MSGCRVLTYQSLLSADSDDNISDSQPDSHYQTKRMEEVFDIFMKNIRDVDEAVKSLDDIFTRETEMDKNVKADKSLSIIQKYKSYQLYQHLFLSRHKRIWFKPLRNLSLLQLAVYLIFTFLLKYDLFPEIDYQTVIVIITSAYIYILYMFDTGQKLIKSYYRNSDYHLLHYAFYRRKAKSINSF